MVSAITVKTEWEVGSGKSPRHLSEHTTCVYVNNIGVQVYWSIDIKMTETYSDAVL